MFCLKCGKETQENQVFCETCLQVMDQYPVKPDAAIHLPDRQRSYLKKTAHRKRVPTQDEVIARLKKTNRCLIWSLAILLLIVLVAGTVLYFLR